jgi:hypothetical protein
MSSPANNKNDLYAEMMSERLDVHKIHTVSIEGIDMVEFPEFTSAFVGEAWYGNVKMTEEALDFLQETQPEFVDKLVWEYLYSQSI